MSGTCLCAAAWKTMPGRCCREHRVDAPPVASCRRPPRGCRTRLPRSRRSFSMAKRLFSYRSKSTRLRGPNDRICRHNSDPIDPPAPVTRTVCPAMRCLTGSGSRPTGARGSRSSIASSRIWLTDTLPSITSRRFGSVLIDSLNGSSAFTIPRIVAASAVGIAISTSSGRSTLDDGREDPRACRAPAARESAARPSGGRRPRSRSARRDRRRVASCRGRSSRPRRRRRRRGPFGRWRRDSARAPGA